ncbi:uncharacterized protein LOC110109045 [Dendrobium catenatum]|uniref:uncharacterized protein LOC110109045 n=1 Tax=Dendrobium catenatum TaxID=906689 RepID=UPI0010A09003|nr:uncharacterized protein LOC110109045 [Dendrobium catenatum]
MQRQHQYPKHAKKNPAVKPQIKSKNPPRIVIIPKSARDDNDDRSSVCSIGAFHLRRAAEEEELRLREELEMEIERELEQELIDGISELVRRLSDLKARQIARGLVKVNGGGLTKKAEVDIAGATRRWVVTSFPQRDRAVDFGEESGYDSGCSDAESTTEEGGLSRKCVISSLRP